MSIHLQSLSVSLEHREILKDLSYSFSGGLTYLIGRNGSGKTTLLHSIAQLIPYHGSILLGDEFLSNLSHKKVAQRLALIRQQSSPKFSMKVRDFVLLGRFPYLNWMGSFQSEDYDYADESIQTLRIQHLAEKSITKLSGGEWQKVLIARALTQQTPIILMDEPAQSLDPKNKRDLYLLIAEMSENGKTIICTTHDLEAIEPTHTNLLALKNGEIILQGSQTFDPTFLLEVVY